MTYMSGRKKKIIENCFIENVTEKIKSRTLTAPSSLLPLKDLLAHGYGIEMSFRSERDGGGKRNVRYSLQVFIRGNLGRKNENSYK